MKYRFLILFLILAAESFAQKPNVVLIYADDLGYGDLSCYGAKAIKTPNIDKLAKQGMKFTRGYSTSAT
ncbi:MAG: sulfatase-like hydrolase/transferase, partial [Daejeonella sp.]|nr:sulfatase-like hydrolase/transferase [Daejeonella sp.]